MRSDYPIEQKLYFVFAVYTVEKQEKGKEE
jgi:hypothetical protein